MIFPQETSSVLNRMGWVPGICESLCNGNMWCFQYICDDYKIEGIQTKYAKNNVSRRTGNMLYYLFTQIRLDI